MRDGPWADKPPAFLLAVPVGHFAKSVTGGQAMAFGWRVGAGCQPKACEAGLSSMKPASRDESINYTALLALVLISFSLKKFDGVFWNCGEQSEYELFVGL